MQTMNRAKFFSDFINGTLTTNSYGSDYVVSNGSVSILLNKRLNEKPSQESISIILMKINISPNRFILFSNFYQSTSTKAASRRDIVNLLEATPYFYFPSIWTLDKDLLSFTIEDIREAGGSYNVLLKSSFGKFLLCQVPDFPNISTRQEFLKANDSITILAEVSSQVTQASKEALCVDDFDKYYNGVWFKDTHRSTIEEFIPSEEELEKFFNPPSGECKYPFYNALLGKASKHSLVPWSYYSSDVGFTSLASAYKFGQGYDTDYKNFLAELDEWKIFAQDFVKKYVSFNKQMFLNIVNLVSEGSPSQYFSKDGKEFIIGTLKNYTTKNLIKLSTWHEMKKLALNSCVIRRNNGGF